MNFNKFLIFIAKSMMQETLYPLLDIRYSNFISRLGLQAIECEKILLTLNENYILLLANLIDYHFEDTLNIYTKMT